MSIAETAEEHKLCTRIQSIHEVAYERGNKNHT
jgi:hypothetical protein